MIPWRSPVQHSTIKYGKVVYTAPTSIPIPFAVNHAPRLRTLIPCIILLYTFLALIEKMFALRATWRRIRKGLLPSGLSCRPAERVAYAGSASIEL